MSPSRVRVLTAAALVLTPILAAGGQSGVAVSPFVSYIPSAATNPLAGFALTFGGNTGLGLRAGAEMSIANAGVPDTLATAGGVRPWGADADLMLFLGGLGGGATVFSRSLSPYAFAGIGMFGADSAGRNVVHNGWSYGVGAAIPLGMFADIFGEARWRMSEYVLPTSQNAPDSKSSMRFGLSFHVGGGGQPAPTPRRGRYGHGGEENDVEYVVTQPAAAPAPVVVVQQPAQQEPQVIYVEQEPQPEPVVIMTPDRSRERRPDYPVVSPDPVVVTTPAESRPRTRVIGRSTRSSRSTTVQSQSRTSPTVTKVATRRPGIGTRTTVGTSNRTASSSNRTATSNRSSVSNRTVTSTRTPTSSRTVARPPARAEARTETKSSAPLSRARVESVRKKKPE